MLLDVDRPARDPLPESSEFLGNPPFKIDEKAVKEVVEMMMGRASRSKLREGSSSGRVVGKGSGSEGWAGGLGRTAERMSRMRS